MKSSASISPAFVSSQYAPYNSSVATSASSSTSSLWSNASSQASDNTSISQASFDHKFTFNAPNSNGAAEIPVELRQNPRRTQAPARPAPALVRQADRKVNFVDSLVDSSTQVVEAIWPLSSVVGRSEPGCRVPLPLRTFIQETLRRSRTSYSTLQVALYYLILIKPHVPQHNFTMEQPVDSAVDRALQCGRRMFLSALILASKYLQDRNYSARAWSRISGLNTSEINQNEIAFLIAVEWKLHIPDDIFQRWTDVVLKHIPPPSPPSPGGMISPLAQQNFEWKQFLLQLEPDLSNACQLVPTPRLTRKTSDLSMASPRCILNVPQDDAMDVAEASPTTTGSPGAASYIPGTIRPSLARMPSHPTGPCTPAAGAGAQFLCKSGSMGFAMAQACTVASTQYLDRFPFGVNYSPQSSEPVRRSSLANSVSTTSSPESMVSDSSRTSRSSSISSASSLPTATSFGSALSFQSRLRGATKMSVDRLVLRSTISSVPEDYSDYCQTPSPDSYTGPVGKLGDMCLETPLACRERLNEMVPDADSDAARALQDLHSYGNRTSQINASRAGAKRSRPTSLEAPLQDNVREILQGQRCSAWPNTLVRSRGFVSEPYLKVPVRSMDAPSKRLCCSTEAMQESNANSSRPGMWAGILN